MQDITAGTRDKPLPANETTLYTHIRAQCLFHLATCQIYSLIISTPYPNAKELIELDNVHIGGWHSSLPLFFQEHAYQPAKYRLAHSILRWRYRNFRILMYRPFLVRRVLLKPRPDNEGSASGDNPDVETAIQRCLEAAKETVNLISTFWFENEQTMMTYWYCLYFLFQAVLIPIICLRNDPQSHSADSWRDQIVETIRVLESMVLLNPTAERCLDVVRSLCSSYLTVEENLYGPTDESPQTQLTNLYPMMWPTLEAAQFEGVDAMLQESTIMEFMNQIPGFN
jgi:transcriptional regulatory protein GAL4